jgi:phage terminase large subunit-like protein
LENQIYVQNYLTNLNDLKYKLHNSDIDSLNYNEFSTKLKNLEQGIYERIEEFLKIKNPNHNYSEAAKLVELLNENNELFTEF